MARINEGGKIIIPSAAFPERFLRVGDVLTICPTTQAWPPLHLTVEAYDALHDEYICLCQPQKVT